MERRQERNGLNGMIFFFHTSKLSNVCFWVYFTIRHLVIIRGPADRSICIWSLYSPHLLPVDGAAAGAAEPWARRGVKSSERPQWTGFKHRLKHLTHLKPSEVLRAHTQTQTLCIVCVKIVAKGASCYATRISHSLLSHCHCLHFPTSETHQRALNIPLASCD